MTTGSFEGSLTMEGIPDRFERVLSRGHGRAVSAVLRSSDPRQTSSTRGRAARTQLPRRRERRETPEGSRQGCQRLGRTRLRGKTTPTLLHPKRKAQGCTVQCRATTRRSGLRRRENAWSPGLTARSQRLRGVSTPRKRRTEPGTSEVRVHVIRLDGRNRFVASRVFSVGRSQGRSVGRGR